MYILSKVKIKEKWYDSYSPLLANSKDLIAVVFRPPVVTLNEAAISRLSMLKAKIWGENNLVCS